jgi:hypothetical protein
MLARLLLAVPVRVDEYAVKLMPSRDAEFREGPIQVGGDGSG